MMRDETDSILDDLLSRWHHWCKGNQYQNEVAADPAFKGHRSSRQWDTLDEVLDTDLNSIQMEAMDFAITGDWQGKGAMEDPYKAAILVNARNCYTGREVWFSPRLPSDREARKVLVLEARVMLLKRLVVAGVV